jgi:subtilisin-like proprotein convertase family protein
LVPYDPGIDDAASVPVAAPAGTSATAADVTGADAIAASAGIVHPVPPTGYVEDQLDGYTYGATTVYGSNIIAAWRYSTGLRTSVALIDDGFDPATTKLYGDFSNALSRSFAVGSSYRIGFASASNIGEPAGGYHGTTTSGLIGDSGANGLPVGLAPNAEIIGVKVTFGNVPFSTFVEALQYASAVGEVINNSWAFSGYGVGEPTDWDFAAWYSALNAAVKYGRFGLGDIVVFAAGNDRADANTVALQPITANPEVIAVAASDPDGLVASYSNPGPGLLVAAIGDNVAVPLPGGTLYGLGSGTSYAAPTVSAIVSLMLSVNPKLGWRDVQEILADSAYAPPPSAGGFTTNGATGWNGGGMQFSEDLGFGVVDANVAVNLARAWTEQSTSANQVSRTVTDSTSVTIAPRDTVSPTLAVTADIRIQQVEVTITDTNLLAADSKLVLISPDGTQSILLNDAGLVAGTDLTGGLDLTGSVIADNAFWGEIATGTWTLEVENTGGSTAVLQDWSLTLLGDNAATVATPLVYTPEFASLAAADPARTVVSPGTATSIDLIALPGATAINLNATTGTIDGVAVTLRPGLVNANADGSTGSVTLVGLAAGGSELTGGDGPTTITGYGRDTINGGLGATTIGTGAGGSTVALSSLATATTQDTITSGGGDTIWAGSGTVSITDTATGTGSKGDTIFDQSATLTFINASGASVLYAGSGTVLVQAGAGGGVYYAGSGLDSQLTAGAGKVVFYGGASGDVLTAAGAANDMLIAGAGSETLLGGAATGTLVMEGGSGSDIMTAGDGRTDFTVGTGNDTITDGGIADVITTTKGHAGGLDMINNFRVGVDQLDLVRYSASTASNAISSQMSDGHGGTLLFLPDGTRLDLVGIAHATSSVFT